MRFERRKKSTHLKMCAFTFLKCCSFGFGTDFSSVLNSLGILLLDSLAIWCFRLIFFPLWLTVFGFIFSFFSKTHTLNEIFRLINISCGNILPNVQCIPLNSILAHIFSIFKHWLVIQRKSHDLKIIWFTALIAACS